MGREGGARVALVGHCGFDSGGLTRAVQNAIDGAEVFRVNDQASLEAAVTGGADLLLVNRVLDGRFDASDGIGLIEAVASRGGPPTMLISNYDDAQALAVQAGARPGFGKKATGDAGVAQLIRDAAGRGAGA